MVRSENDPSAVCSEVAPKRIHSSPKPLLMPFLIIASSIFPLRLKAHPVQQFAARPHLLERKQIAAFVMHAGQAITDELLGDVGQPVAIALLLLFFGEGLAFANVVEYVSRAVGDASVEFAVCVVVVGSADADWECPC